MPATLDEQLAALRNEVAAAKRSNVLNLAAPVRLLEELYRRAEQRETLAGVLYKVPAVAADAYEAWNTDQDSRVGKILVALCGTVRGYRADIDALHAALAICSPRPDDAGEGVDLAKLQRENESP